MRTINGWPSIKHPDFLVLASGDNHDVEAQQYMVIIPIESNQKVTGFIPPLDPPHPEDGWIMTVANGSPTETMRLPNDEGSTVGYRIMLEPGTSYFEIPPYRKASLYFSPSPLQGWFLLLDGALV